MVQVSWVSMFLIPLIVLMLWMDVALFVKIQHLPPAHFNANNLPEPQPEQTSLIHSAFERLTMKLLVSAGFSKISSTNLFVLKSSRD